MSLPALGILSHTWRETAAKHQECGCVLSMFPGMEKQELTLTPRGEARTQRGHSAQTSGDGARLGTHMGTHSHSLAPHQIFWLSAG